MSRHCWDTHEGSLPGGCFAFIGASLLNFIVVVVVNPSTQSSIRCPVIPPQSRWSLSTVPSATLSATSGKERGWGVVPLMRRARESNCYRPLQLDGRTLYWRYWDGSQCRLQNTAHSTTLSWQTRPVSLITFSALEGGSAENISTIKSFVTLSLSWGASFGAFRC